MQLLSPEQIKKISRDVENANKRILADLSIKIFEKTRQLNTLQSDIERNVKADQERQIERNQTIVELNNQIALLENERKKLMIPVEAIKENLENQTKEILQLKHSLTQKEIDIAEQRDELFRKSEEFIEWEQLLNEKAETLTKDIQVLEAERAEVNRISTALQTQLQSHTEKIDSMNKHYATKESELAQGNYALSVRELTFAKQKEEWENIKTAQELQLADQRTTLERALNRLNK